MLQCPQNHNPCILDNKKAAPVLLECVKRLEYRGYDSVGIATSGSDIEIKKDKGKIDDVQSNLGLTDLPGEMGIAHVRWATHGLPTKENAHPHTDCKDRIAVVHNGIIENYKELKGQLEKEGHVFKSETDTEVIPHLIEISPDTCRFWDIETCDILDKDIFRQGESGVIEAYKRVASIILDEDDKKKWNIQI